ncbi:MAG: tetratricopeptide repeat protein [Phycisphaeraceae bacterium]|nr:tetratricopeptide repeat protein [Phycisphaeraceae bacterium]
MQDWTEAERIAERALRRMEAGLWVHALRDWDCILLEEPEHAQWLLGRAMTLQFLGREEEAARLSDRVRDIRCDHAAILVHLSQTLLKGGRLKEALACLNLATELDPGAEAPFCESIEVLRRLGRHEEAETAFYQARQLSEHCPVCLDHLGRSLFNRGLIDRAIWCWRQSLLHNPEREGVRRRLGMALRSCGRLDEARQVFLDQLGRDPDDPDTLAMLGDLLRQMGRAAEAGARFAQVLELDPRHAEAHYRVGELALAAGHLEAAEARFLRARELRSDMPGPNLGLARLAKRRGAMAASKRYLLRELKLERPLDEQVLELARTLVECQMAVPAIELLTKLIQHARRTHLPVRHLATAYLFRAVAHLTCGRCDLGIADCRSCLKLAPDHFAAHQNLILAYLVQGRLTRARACLRVIARRNPHDARLHSLRRHVRRAVWRQIFGFLGARTRRAGTGPFGGMQGNLGLESGPGSAGAPGTARPDAPMDARIKNRPSSTGKPEPLSREPEHPCPDAPDRL